MKLHTPPHKCFWRKKEKGDELEMAHALLSPSGAHRWLVCTPSARLEEWYPDTAGSYAQEGTDAHALAAIKAAQALGRNPTGLEAAEASPYYSAEMAACAEQYAALVSEAAQRLAPCKTLLEEGPLPLKSYVPGGYGTCDLLVLSAAAMEVLDFKYGKGVLVSAKDNPQLRLYALGALEKYPEFRPPKIRLSIFQPRAGARLSEETLSLEELLEWGENVVKPAAALAFAGEGDYKPGPKQCRFCRAGGDCRARAEMNAKPPIEVGPAATLTPAELGAALEKAADMEAWLEALRARAASLLASGEPVPGWKLVEGRGQRKMNEEKAAAALLEAGYPEAQTHANSLLTLTALEKLLGKKTASAVLGPSITWQAGKNTLAPMTDERPAIGLG